MPNTEEEFKVGDRVILGEHDRSSNGHRYNWNSDMDQFVGTETFIKKISGDCVIVDSNDYVWYIKNLKHVDNRFNGMLPEEEFADA
jgi:hypothetical protein